MNYWDIILPPGSVPVAVCDVLELELEIIIGCLQLRSTIDEKGLVIGLMFHALF
jgi:hypothetical protein